jgi:dolichol-phosphate mannosyltransferase
MDADNTHDPCIIPALVRKLKSEGLNVVVASRFTDGGREIGLSLNRRSAAGERPGYLDHSFPSPMCMIIPAVLGL